MGKTQIKKGASLKTEAQLAIMREAGRIVAEGLVEDIVTAELIEDVFQLACVVIDDPLTGKPMIVPQPRGQQR